MARSMAWIHHLSAENVAELEAAASAAGQMARPLVEIRREHFALPHLGPVLVAIRRELLHGRGFVLVRGLPRERYTLAEAATIFWGLGTHLGAPLSQNAQGHVLGHVKDLGYQADDPRTRLYQTNQRQGYHTDSADIVGLLCIRPARSGGRSSLASTVTAYNEMLARRPDLLSALFEPVATDHRGEVPPGGRPWFSIRFCVGMRDTSPVFTNAGTSSRRSAFPTRPASPRDSARRSTSSTRSSTIRPCTSRWTSDREIFSSSITTRFCTTAPPSRMIPTPCAAGICCAFGSAPPRAGRFHPSSRSATAPSNRAAAVA
jgi:hypothetical protein